MQDSNSCRAEIQEQSKRIALCLKADDPVRSMFDYYRTVPESQKESFVLALAFEVMLADRLRSAA